MIIPSDYGCLQYFCRILPIPIYQYSFFTKGKKQRECARDLNDPNPQNEIFRIAKQMVKERQDITGSNCLKGVLGKVIVDEKGIKDSWKEYMEKLTNEENEWDHSISTTVKEGPADCIRIDEVAAA